MIRVLAQCSCGSVNEKCAGFEIGKVAAEGGLGENRS